MKQVLLAGMIAFAPAVVAAEESDFDRGMGLLEEGTKLFFQGLIAEIGPRMDELEDALDNLSGYHAPEILPNGDIIIRRKQPVERDALQDGEIEL
ncbi:MAG: hypothetical protein AAGO57_00135 [Pseudomonadota bacterium]